MHASLNSGAFRFGLAIAGLFAIGSLLLFAVVERSIEVYAADATSVGLKTEVAILTDEMADGGRERVVDLIAHRLRAGADPPYRYLVIDPAGRRIAGDLPSSSVRVGRGSVTLVDAPAAASEAAAPEVLQSLGVRLSDGSTLVVATDTFDIQNLKERVDTFLIVSGLALTILALLGGYFVGWILLRRLERVNRAIGRIMAGRLSERLPRIGMSPEFDRLSDNLNLMLDRIDRLMESMRQVSTDIAHDLRTPLTRLQHQLETLREAQSEEDSKRGIEAALQQIAEMLVIFRALLRIGALEAGDGRQRLATVNLAEVLTRVGEAYRPLAEDGGQDLQTEVAGTFSVLGDAELLAQLLTNLIENALAYAGRGARIRLLLSDGDDGPAVTVADDGPGVPADERVRIVQRFYRLDTSRHTHGAGLGLSLVAAIAGLHDARLQLDDNRPGLKVTVQFPIWGNKSENKFERRPPDDAAADR